VAKHSDASGDVEVMVRPESVRLMPDEASECVITDVEYFGHDRMLRAALRSGGHLRSRVAGESKLRGGDRVRVEVIGAVAVFPRAD
jgi:hypothetical protein